jgi:hypothetical protein
MKKSYEMGGSVVDVFEDTRDNCAILQDKASENLRKVCLLTFARTWHLQDKIYPGDCCDKA